MLKGVLIGLILFFALDSAVNDGRYTHQATAKLVHFAHASADAFGSSIFAL